MHSAYKDFLSPAEVASSSASSSHSLHHDFLFGSAPGPAAAPHRAVASGFLAGPEAAAAGRQPRAALPGSAAGPLGLPDTEGPEHARLAEAGLGLGSSLHKLRTGLMVAGGLCSKLFGLGMVGFLAFQSIRANLAEGQRQQQQERQQPRAALPGAAAPACPSRHDGPCGCSG
mmetsp:Transcript_11478/g.36000  ORF Transcript_11478/g.36000 Transcript_11478/m.36000 type:complete len:172 (+) Transcript_11478:73-588(+)